jgi:DNA-binding transcriptional MerR regulator
VLSTLVRHAKTFCDPESLREEIKHLKDTFQCNGYSLNDIRQAVHLKQKTEPEKKKPTGIAVLPYQQTVSNKISRLVAKHNI